MDPIPIIILGFFTLIVGGFVGATGIGGVLLVPYLTFIIGMEAHQAIASTMFAFVFSGFSATLAYAKHGSVRWPMVWKICGSAAPAAFIGSIIVWNVPSEILLAGVAALTLFSGYRTLQPPKDIPNDKENIGWVALLTVGAISGFISALVGAGGAIVAIPLLFAMGMPAILAIGLSQTLHFTIAATATIGNISFGEINYGVSAMTGTALIVGILMGTRFAHALPIDTLRKTIAWVLTLVGISIIFLLGRTAISL